MKTIKLLLKAFIESIGFLKKKSDRSLKNNNFIVYNDDLPKSKGSDELFI